MFGSFSKESLEKFQEMQGLTSNQDFSEGLFDFKVCQKPDGKHYGIPESAKCEAPAREVTTRPSAGPLGIHTGKGVNYDTAREQGLEKSPEGMKQLLKETAADALQKRKKFEKAQKDKFSGTVNGGDMDKLQKNEDDANDAMSKSISKAAQVSQKFYQRELDKRKGGNKS
jgi:hypothetical protein